MMNLTYPTPPPPPGNLSAAAAVLVRDLAHGPVRLPVERNVERNAVLGLIAAGVVDCSVQHDGSALVWLTRPLLNN